MISLKKSIEVLEEQERRERDFAGALSGLLKACERSIELLVEETPECKLTEGLRALEERVINGLGTGTLQDCGTKFGDSFFEWLKTIATEWRAKEQEYKRIVSVVTEAATASSAASVHRSGELNKFANEVEAVSRVSDIMEVRRRLELHVQQLRVTAENMEADARRQADALKTQLARAQARLKEANDVASVDALTGLASRRTGDATLARAISRGNKVRLLLIDLDGFKDINDRYGHKQGDQLLKLFADGLRECVRSVDLACRWGGDEFLVILRNTDSVTADRIASRIRTSAFGISCIYHMGRQVQVRIEGCIGIAEHIVGETPEELFERADRLLYEEKKRLGRAGQEKSAPVTSGR